MRRLKCVVTIIICCVSIAATGCDCEKRSIRDSYKNANTVFIGKVLDVKSTIVRDSIASNKTGDSYFYSSHTEYTYTFLVHKYYKGNNERSTMYLKSTDQENRCAYSFIKGETYLVYSSIFGISQLMYEDASNTALPYYSTSQCTRTNRIENVKRKELNKIARYRRKKVHIEA